MTPKKIADSIRGKNKESRILRTILINNLKVVSIFAISAFHLFVSMWVLWGLNEIYVISDSVYCGMKFLFSLLLLWLHYFLGKEFLQSSGNAVIDILSFVVIAVICTVYIRSSTTEVISADTNFFLSHYAFLEPILGERVSSVGVGVVLSCTTQYVGLLSKAVKGL